jgi:hypothetical protein
MAERKFRSRKLLESFPRNFIAEKTGKLVFFKLCNCFIDFIYLKHHKNEIFTIS